MLIVFSRPTCAPCASLKRYLAMKKVAYIEKPAEGEEYQEQAQKYGYIVPLVVKGDDGFIGLNFSRLNELLAHEV